MLADCVGFTAFNNIARLSVVFFSSLRISFTRMFSYIVTTLSLVVTNMMLEGNREKIFFCTEPDK